MWTTKSPRTIFAACVAVTCSIALAQPAGSSAALEQKPGAKAQFGDLSGIRAIAVDALKIVGTDDFDAARKRIKDLEVGWDRAEPKMKLVDSRKRQALDEAIDRALREVRHWRPKRTDSRQALEAVIARIDAIK